MSECMLYYVLEHNQQSVRVTDAGRQLVAISFGVGFKIEIVGIVLFCLYRWAITLVTHIEMYSTKISCLLRPCESDRNLTITAIRSSNDRVSLLSDLTKSLKIAKSMIVLPVIQVVFDGVRDNRFTEIISSANSKREETKLIPNWKYISDRRQRHGSCQPGVRRISKFN